MNKAGADPKVKKTLVRNYERKLKPTITAEVVREVESCGQVSGPGYSQKETVLNEPSLCSSAALANYLSDIKATLPPPLSAQDITNIDQGELCAKMTKKLNFHFNDKIYKNLVELNANVEEIKTTRPKKPASSETSSKKDLEPDIEDFCEDELEIDTPPKISVIKPKFRPVKAFENGQLHKLVASYEVL